MDADNIDEVVEFDDVGQEQAEDDGGELAQEDVKEEDAGDELDVPVDATVTDLDNSVATGTTHSSSVYCIDIRDGVACTGSGDDSGRLWSLSSNSCTPTATLSGHSDSIVACGFSKTAKCFVATASYDGTIRIWSKDGRLLHVVDGPAAEIEWMQWHEKGDVLLAGSADCTTWMWGVSQTQVTCMQVYAGHEAPVTCGLFAAQGKLVATGSADQSVRVWEPKTGKLSMTFSGSGWAEGPITCIVTAETSPTILAGSQDGTARLANVTTKRILATLAHDPSGLDAETSASVEAVGLDRHQNWAYTAGTDGQLCVWDLNTASRRSTFLASGGAVKLLLAPELNLVAVTTNVGCVDLFDPRADSTQRRFSGHKGLVLDIARQDNLFATAGDDSLVKLFDVRKL